MAVLETLFRTSDMKGSPSLSAALPYIATHISPPPSRRMRATSAGVVHIAGMTISVSPSLSSASKRSIILPFLNASIALSRLILSLPHLLYDHLLDPVITKVNRRYYFNNIFRIMGSLRSYYCASISEILTMKHKPFPKVLFWSVKPLSDTLRDLFPDINTLCIKFYIQCTGIRVKPQFFFELCPVTFK